MARIRTVKPEFWQDERMAGISRDARLLFLGLISMADDEGRLRGHPMLIRSTVFPYEPDVDVLGLLSELESKRRIQRYEFGGESYVWLPKFRDHQRIDKPTASVLPVPPPLSGSSTPIPRALPEPSKSAPGVVAEDSRQEGKGKEGSGEERMILPVLVAVEPDGAERIQQAWNEHAPSELSRCRSLTKDRKASALARLKEHSLSEITAAIQRIARSKFLRGGGDRGWKADVDWLLRPGTIPKLLEGKWDDFGQSPPAAPSGPPCSVPGCATPSTADAGGQPICREHDNRLNVWWQVAAPNPEGRCFESADWPPFLAWLEGRLAS